MSTLRTKALWILIILLVSGLSACDSPQGRLEKIIGPRLANRVMIRKFVDKSGKDYLLAWKIECDEKVFDAMQSGTYEIRDEETSLKIELRDMVGTSIPQCTVRKRCNGTDCTIFFRTSSTTGYVLAYKSR